MKYSSCFLLAVLVAAGTPKTQKQCVETFATHPLNSNTTMGGPNLLLAMKLTAPRDLRLAAAQVQTGLRAGPASMAVHAHDSSGDRPGASLSGTGAYRQTARIAWQGAKFPRVVSLRKGTVFWLVWGMPAGSRTPWGVPSAGTIPYRGSFDGGKTWNGANGGRQPWPPKSFKIRLFCDAVVVPVRTIGTSKPGRGGVAPTQRLLGWPVNGNELGVLLERGAPGVPAFLVLGPPANLPAPPLGTLWANPSIVVPQSTSGSSRSGPGTGEALVTVPLPDGYGVGFTFATQWVLLDPAAAAGVSHTFALVVVIS